jgi:hypothetical protein
MTADWLRFAFLQIITGISGGPPKNLVTRVKADADDHDTEVTAADLTAMIAQASVSDPFLTVLGMEVHKWDAQPLPLDWANDTAPSTTARRDVICKKLGLDEAGAAALLKQRSIYIDPTIVITGKWEKWYTPERAATSAFYWKHYSQYLLNVRKWPQNNVTSLDLATSKVVERLADPTWTKAYQSKGLVVGYVQSGKTANFTGVIAKAIDAGYRLIIVMTGTIEMLRSQTQRRIDMELVGKKNIVGDRTPEEAIAQHVDYQDDPDWKQRFQDFSGDPVHPGIRRLTHHKTDYQDEFTHLKFERANHTKPLYAPENIANADARLVITKKNSKVLEKLVDNVTANKKAFAEVPVLIIDDESDQASVNTIDPEKKKPGDPERRAINGHIARLLELMPRAQYVGYTATPFANVFVDPRDPLGIYPKDFLISLPWPDGYMGVEDFHDLEPVDEPVTAANSNYDAYVRDLRASESPADEKKRLAELQQALDIFVLTGACKLYRATQPDIEEFKHHTMLVHESVRNGDQKELAQTVRNVWARAGFTSPASVQRLRDLYIEDVLRVSEARREKNIPALPDFETLKPFIAKAISRITEHNNNPVLVVNSDPDIQHQQQQLDFDRNRTWRVLVGGAKLSRGFTVEGLTVTYFRRTVKLADALTQMGRWFGFRHGYRDLVRLYIDRNAKFTATQRVDLYKAFEAVTLDERAFRSQLAMYAEWDGDKPRVLPSQIPPLVSQHLPWLKPAAGNKMFNAVLEEESDPALNPSGYPYVLKDQHANLCLWRQLLADYEQDIPVGGQGGLQAYTETVDATKLIDLIDQMQWMYEYKAQFIQPRLTYFRRLIEMKPAPLADFLLVMPQPGDQKVEIAGVGPRKIINRDRRTRGGDPMQKFGEITDPKHRKLIEPLLLPTKPAKHPLEKYWSPTRGVGLVYLVKEQHPQFEPGASKTPPPGASSERGIILAFALYLPTGAAKHTGVLKFRVRVPRDPAATVDIPKSAAVQLDSQPST